jgi:NitT/TauT family transport system substrate-binding protein
MNRRITIFAILVIAVLLAAGAPARTLMLTAETPEATVSATPDKVKVAYVAIMNFAPLYVAIGRGFMAEQNIEVEMQKVASGSEAMAFLANGSLDAGGVGIQAATFNAFVKGFDLRIVASAALQPEKNGPTIIIVRKELQDSGKVKSIADLKGMKVAIAGGVGTTGAYFVAKALKEAGLTVKDIQIVNLANPDMQLAIENGAVDAALVGPPYSNQIIAGGKGVMLAQDTAPGAMTTVYMYSGKFIKERPEVAKRFMVALVKASRAMQGAAYLAPENIAAYLKYVTSTEDAIKKGKPQVYDPDLKVYIDSIKNMEEIFRWAGWTDYTEVIPEDKMADSSFEENAVKVLGPFETLPAQTPEATESVKK